MGLLINVLSFIVIVFVFVLIYNYFTSHKIQLSHLKSGTQSSNIEAAKLPMNKASNNYAYSIWFYVKDWQHRLTDKKELLNRGSNNDSNPRITLAAYENNININITTYPSSDPNTQKKKNSDGPASDHDCTIRNFPLQKWVNLIISLNGRTLDVYLDGKLVRTCVLPGVAKINPDAAVNITPGGGFSGWTSNFQYWSKPLNPQEAYNVYKKGYGSSSLGGLFEKYKIKLAYLVDNQEEGSIVI